LGGAAPAVYYLARLMVSVLAVYFVYRAYVRLVEKRPVTELARVGTTRKLGVGIFFGVGLVAVVVGILWLLGYYRIVAANALAVVFALPNNDGAEGLR
jgi:hypothetical protein